MLLVSFPSIVYMLCMGEVLRMFFTLSISSLIISLVFSMSKNAFIYYVFLNKSYTTMYGSFAILMFLFLWIYVSWIIFIYGLKLCYIIDGIYKNRDREQESK